MSKQLRGWGLYCAMLFMACAVAAPDIGTKVFLMVLSLGLCFAIEASR